LYYCLSDIIIEYVDRSVKTRNREELRQIWDGERKYVLGQPGDSFYFERGQLHTAQAMHSEAQFIDIAFGHNDEADIVRIYDRYGRS
jgi:hypothetical protein